ncbi:MAG TPA: hypothetical protein VI791_03025, partial [Patescibacteria group bacterium]|nr:hypothetical protein [Patescibacteria group bacterium]
LSTFNKGNIIADTEALSVTGAATVAGTLTAQSSASISGALTLYTTPTIQSTSNQTLTFGGNSSGNLSLAPQNGAVGSFVAPSIDNQVDLGQSNLRWRNVYAGNVFANVTGVQGYWQRNGQALTPTFISDDLLMGAISTASAFVKLTGTPNNDSWINTGRFGVGTMTPLATTDLRSMLGTIPVASISGATSLAALVVDNSGTGDIFTASSSGLNRFVITQAGNVGIGTTVPSELLDVVGNATVSGNLTFYDGARTIAGRLNTTLTIGDTQTGNLVINPTGRTAFYNTTPRAGVDIRAQLGTIAVASISGATSFATLVVDNSLNYDIFAASSSGARRMSLASTGDLTLWGSSAAATPPTGRLLPGFDSVQDIGSSTKQWKSIYISNAIQNGATVSINLATQHFGDNGAGLWTFDNDASVSGNLNVVGTTWLGCNVAYPPGCGNPLTSQLIVGVSGTGKIDVGTIDPPYTINGEKYATYLPAMIGQNEEVTGNIQTTELVANVGYRTTIDFSNLPKASNLWLFSKVTDLKTHIRDLAIVLTPASAARTWYELEPSRMLLHIYSSQPTTVSYRFTAPRFDSEKWINTRPAEGIAGFVISDPDLPLNNLAQNGPLVLDPTFTETNINQYELKLGNNPIAEIGSYAALLVANLTTGIINTQKLFSNEITSPIANIDTLKVNSKLLSPLAQIDTLVATNASISGTLYATDLQSPVIDNLNEKYASASAILAAIKAKYSDYAALTAPEPGPVATISGEYALYNQPVIITDTLLVNTSLISNSLNSAEGALYLQPTASAPINLLAGLMTLTPDGQVLINGDLTVTGKLYANNITGTQTTTDNLIASLATISGQLIIGARDPSGAGSSWDGEPYSGLLPGGTESASNSGNLASFFNKNGQLVSAINASGAASFRELATSGLIIASAATESATATSSGAFNTNATIGTGTITAGTTELIIANSNVRLGTYVYLTPISNTSNQVLYIKSKQEGAGFTVAINQALTTDIMFNYWLIQTQP